MDTHFTADLRTMSKRVESEQYYVTFEMFVADVKRMFANARTYNSPDTIYYKCATRYVDPLNSVYAFHLLSPNFNKIAGWKPTFKAKFSLVYNPAPKFSSNVLNEGSCFDFTKFRRSFSISFSCNIATFVTLLLIL